MSKTIAISDNTHTLIVEKQMEIYKKYRVNVRIFDVADIILKNFIDKTEELLGLRGRMQIGEEESLNTTEGGGIKNSTEAENNIANTADVVHTDQIKEAN